MKHLGFIWINVLQTLLRVLLPEQWNLLDDKERKGPRVFTIDSADPSSLHDVLSVIDGDKVEMAIVDANSSSLVTQSGEMDSRFVVMPMRL